MRAIEAAQCAEIAYRVNGKGPAAQLGYQYKQIRANCLRGWIGHKEGKTVVAIRGTVFPKNGRSTLEENLLTDLVHWCGPGKVHEGFYRLLWRLLRPIKQHLIVGNRLYFTGHSMGAALAVLAASVIGADRVFVFGCPRIGDQEFAQEINRTLRVTRYENRCDLVTRLPIKGALKHPSGRTGLYKPVGRVVKMSAFGHSMKAYINGLQMRA
ncbi:lipase family protein [Sneathiella aquimaris]|uniref:lipase family protein n=1 Tax=Sneathiella aquimaris TaxID=2599305 RepID=UPI00146D7554|nr:lipase family protein [Sneathiella aquimaris]